MKKRFDPKHAKAHGYTRADWDAVDAPEATNEELALSRPLAEALPELADRIDTEIARRGRPRIANPKVAVSVRLDADVLEHLKSGGKGWQSRLNATLRESLGI